MLSSIEIPKRLPILLVADNVLLPGSSMRIPVRSLRNMNMVKSRLLSHSTLSSTIIGVVPREPTDRHGEDGVGLHLVGTAAVVVQVTGSNWPTPAYTLLATGFCRFKIDKVLQETPYLVAKVTQLDKLSREEIDDDTKVSGELASLAENFREQAGVLVDMLDISIPMVAKLKKMLDSVPVQHLPDICASLVKTSYAEKIQVLDAVNVSERFKKTLPLLMRQIEGLKLIQKTKRTSSPLSPVTLSHAGRKSVKTFDEGLNDDDDDDDEILEFERRIRASGMPADALKTSLRELKRLKKMPQQMPEHAMLRNYLELMVDLPWSKMTSDKLDITQARKDLDVDHCGLDKLKKRVIEYLAVRQIKNSLRGPILCFVGPPGVGKTSVGQSIAKTLGREFYRIALGGICDQSDIRGHRRTYIGSMPGRIIQGLKHVGVRNPIFLLDEIDKLSRSLHGDPAAALLEVLDPQQNHTFVDHYLNVAFDLSQVLFIATANTLSTIPPALLDRMEVIHIPGYTHEEKLHIAVRHLVPKQLLEHGLTNDHLHILDESIRLLIESYTREAGVRTLERRIGALCRAVAVKVAEHLHKLNVSKPSTSQSAVNNEDSAKAGKQEVDASETVDIMNVSNLTIPPKLPIVIDMAAVEDILGPPRFTSETRERLSQPGVAIGLAWTTLGGEIMYVEATQMTGDGKLTLTGQLGDVMKESANLAMNWLRSNARRLGLQLGLEVNQDLLKDTDVHIHFPAGAISKDGPSAGVAIATVLVSLFADRCVRSDTAMTGEVTLRGLVLPIGGVKEKVLAAHRAGVTRVILPKRNEKDLYEVPADVQNCLTFIFVSSLDEVLNAAFDGGLLPLVNTSADIIPSKL